MKYLSALLVLLLVCCCSQTVRAQATDSWVSVNLAGERFTVQLPNSQVAKRQKISFDKFKAEGRVYTATSDGVDYSVWSLVDEGYASNGPRDNSAYLDACADLVWESLLKPLRDELPKKPQVVSNMSYQRELQPGGLPPGREYTISLGNRLGVTHFYVAGPRIYVLTVLNTNASFAAAQRFINSFGIKGQEPPATLQSGPTLTAPSASVGTGRGIGTGAGIGPGRGVGLGIDPGIGPGRGGNMGGGDRNIGGGAPPAAMGDSTDYKRIFSGREVTQKARVLSKPEPSYTETARKYAVQGTVILRAVFSSSGEVNNIKVVKGLPHGLTSRAIAAARQMKFSPAIKDQHAVSMFIQLEYNFNLY